MSAGVGGVDRPLDEGLLLSNAGVAVAIIAGVAVAVVVVVLLELEEVPPAGEGFTIVVLVSVPGDAVGPAAGVTSVCCSHAARRAALARIQMDFFIIRMGCPYRDKEESNAPQLSAFFGNIFVPCGLRRTSTTPKHLQPTRRPAAGP